MISVVTATYNTDPAVLTRTWSSLKLQSFTDWEWVVYDDSTTDQVKLMVDGFCTDERYRIRYFRPRTPSGGNIGYVKRMAFGLALGDILVELDHDDELTRDCLESVSAAFDDSRIGFVYSDCCEILPSGLSGKYPEGWGLGFGSEYWDEDHQVWAMRVPVNRTTVSHIVSMPNHVRAWSRQAYQEAGGHDPTLPVADDYDLMIRTLLVADYRHIPKMLYRQHIGPDTAQRQKNRLIQELVPQIHTRHARGLDAILGSSLS